VSPANGKIVIMGAGIGEDMGQCPCGQKIAIDLVANSVMHALPTCDEFDRRGVTDFLTYVCRARERELAGYMKGQA
jgi:hypothetical protein